MWHSDGFNIAVSLPGLLNLICLDSPYRCKKVQASVPNQIKETRVKETRVKETRVKETRVKETRVKETRVRAS